MRRIPAALQLPQRVSHFVQCLWWRPVLPRWVSIRIRWCRILLEGVVIDSLHPAIPRRRGWWEGVANPGHSGGDFAGNLLIDGNQLCGALANVSCEGSRLGLPSGALGSRTARGAVDD